MTSRLIVDLGDDGMVRVRENLPGEPLGPGDLASFAWPLDAGTVEDLRWYLEDYLRVPYGVYEDRGTRIEAQLRGWGESVFASVFGSGLARDTYARMRQRGDVELVLRSDSPLLLALPWELMADPSCPDPLVVNITGMSRSLLTPADAAEAVSVPVGRLRVLMVISRPSGTGDVGYHMVVRPLLRRLEAVRGSVDLVVLRPPTLRALRDELNSAVQAGRPYQVVHFDGHGIFIGARDRAGGEGALVFERPEGGSHYVPAVEIARVLNAAKIPVVVLNACESGAVGKDLETAVATRLLSEGTPSVVAMAYSVEAVAAAEFMAAFYEKLFSGGSVVSAVTAGRQQMLRRPERPCVKGRMPLRDWMVPVHYLRRDVTFPQAAVARREGLAPLQETLREYRASSADPEDGELDPVNGVFVGRDALFYELEEAARLRRVVVLTGTAGAGKTELAKAFGRWWRDTAGVDQPDWIFWHSFKPGRANFGLDTLITEIGMKLHGTDFAAQDTAQRLAAVRQALHEHRILLIWDGFESVRTMPDPGRVTPALDEQGCAELREFLDDLAEHGNSSVLITSRTPEEWLGKVGRVSIKGLVMHEAAEYADTLLVNYPEARERRTRRAFGDLMVWLDGHPLSMRLTLPRLRTADPEVLLEGLRGTVPPTGTGDADAEWTVSLTASITYSYNHLSPAARRLLPAVSLCRAVADGMMLCLLSEPRLLTDFPELQMPPRFREAEAEDWEAALDGAAQVGLLTHIRGSSLYEIHPALPAFLAATWLAEEPQRYEEDRVATLTALTHVQAGLSLSYLQQIESGDVLIALGTIALQRYTMGSLLGHAIDHEQWAAAQLIMRALNEFWKHARLDAEFDAWAAWVIRATEDSDSAPPPADTDAGVLWLFVMHSQANRYLDLRRLDEAESHYLKILAARRASGSSSETLDAASTYHQLGKVEEARGNASKADEWYRKALSVKEAQNSGNSNLSSAHTYHELGISALSRSSYDEAEKWHRKALQVRMKENDKVGTAGSYHNLGLVAEHRGQLDDAADWYRKELGTLASMASLPRMADAYSQLGNIAIRRDRLREAEEWHRKALVIREQVGDRQGAGVAYGNLGIIAHMNRRFSEAEDWYRRALAVAEEFSYAERIASSCHALGMLAASRDQLAEAAEWYFKALDQDTGNPQDHVLTYGQLGLLAEKRNEPVEALEWMIKCVAEFEEVPHPATGPAPMHLVRLVSGWGRDGMDLLDWWWEETTGKPLPSSVRTYVRTEILRRKRKSQRREQ
jgi:tetratricopeptide (TPR) repeat protein